MAAPMGENAYLVTLERFLLAQGPAMSSITFGHTELPERQATVLRKAIRLEWLTIAFQVFAVILLGLVLGNSQAMKVAWVEDLLSLAPPAAFLLAARIIRKPPSPNGRTGTTAPSASPTWLPARRWSPLVAIWSSTRHWAWSPPSIRRSVGAGVRSGHLDGLADDRGDDRGGLSAHFARTREDEAGRGPARQGSLRRCRYEQGELADRTRFEHRILGIGLGWWWTDSAAALFISATIVHDGVKNMRGATRDLMDARARTYDDARPHPVITKIEDHLAGLDWVAVAGVRVRDEGHVFHVEGFVVPEPGMDPSLDTLDQARRDCAGPGLAYRGHGRRAGP